MTKTLARSLSLGLVLVVVAVGTADARQRRVRAEKPADARVVALLQRVISDNESLRRELVEIKQRLRPDAVASIEVKPQSEPAPSANPVIAPIQIPDPSKTLKGYEQHITRSAKLKDLTPKLAEKVAEILVACPGVHMTSGYRKGARVAGSGRPSLHSHYPSKAADLSGDDVCMMRHLARWPGGLSIDPKAVRHRHLSYAPGSREWGSRFAHYRGSRGSHRMARHYRHAAPRYARAVAMQPIITVASTHTPH